MWTSSTTSRHSWEAIDLASPRVTPEPGPDYMLIPTFAFLSAIAASMIAVTLPATRGVSPAGTGAMCSLVPGRTLALVHVKRDTTLPLAPWAARPMACSDVRTGPSDSLLATASTLMPAARVRLLQVDTATRAALVAAGIGDREPTVLLRAAPYRADCRTIRWTDTIPFVVRVRGS